MSFARRLPVYVLHDGSEYTVRGISRLVDSLRCDPQALEIVWLSFISLAGAAKVTVPLTDICAIGDAGVLEQEAGAPDLDGGLTLFSQEIVANVRRTSATSAGDWRPKLALVITSQISGDFNLCLKALEGLQKVAKFAFVGPALPEEFRSALKGAGFEVFGINDDGDAVGEDVQAATYWSDVLSGRITNHFVWRAIPAQSEDSPPPVELGLGLVPTTIVHASPPELTNDNLFSVDLGRLTTDGRVTRRGLLLYLLLYFGIIALSVFIGYLSMTLASVVSTVGWGIFVLGLIKRAHDLGLSGWYILIPFFGFWLFFAPGEGGPNKFGPDPRASGDVGESGAR